MANKKKTIMLASFAGTGELVHAAETMRDAGYTKFDCHSPFHIHGMDEAMALKRSPVGFVVATGGILGLVGITTLMWWTSAVDFPMVISGKPFFSWQAYIPVAFAITILLSAFGAFLGMLGFNRLPQLHHAVFESEAFASFTVDGFWVSVESDDPMFSRTETESLLKSVGAQMIDIVEAGS